MRVSAEYVLSDEEIDRIWIAYKANPEDSELRGKLVLHYQKLVSYISNSIGSGLPNHIDVEDLQSYGQIGLMDAIKKFDLDRGLRFQTYASQRIHGAIIDELRSIDWVPRSVRSQIKTLEKALAVLEEELSRPPTIPELSEFMDLSEEDVKKTFSHYHSVYIGSLDQKMGDPDDESSDLSVLTYLTDNRTPDPAFYQEVEELKKSISTACATLDEKSAIVAILYYCENLTLAEIGEVLGCTESRSCQLHTRAIQTIRARLSQ